MLSENVLHAVSHITVDYHVEMKKYGPCTTGKILPLHNQKQSASLSVPHHPSHPCLHPLAKESSNPAATLPTLRSEGCSKQ
jgi:hypothetical protein